MGKENKYGAIVGWAGLGLSAAAVVLVILIYGALPKQPAADLVADAKKLAGELADNGLPEAAIEEYRRILDISRLNPGERGAVNYLIAKTYFEDIGNYAQAAAYYIRARALDPNGSYINEAGKNLITSLERMGRSLDARRELDRQANLEPDTTKPAGKLVAKVGSHEVTQAEFNDMIQTLPAEMRDKMISRDERRKFLDQMIGRQVIYDAALRDVYDRDCRVLNDLKNIQKDYLTQIYMREKIIPNVRPDSTELNLYFRANKEKYGGRQFQDVREQVVQDYIMYKGQKTVVDYVNKLREAEPVQVFEENVR